jgi:AraC-like DNA-binding protein
MHADFAHPWSVRELAGLARMSRSTFFLRFTEAVGVPPLAHLLRLRMHSAARSLRDTDGTVAVVGAGVGYRTESAFSVAFKREMGLSPARYRLRTAHRAVGCD